jgi:hypothetical protein
MKRARRSANEASKLLTYPVPMLLPLPGGGGGDGGGLGGCSIFVLYPKLTSYYPRETCSIRWMGCPSAAQFQQLPYALLRIDDIKSASTPMHYPRVAGVVRKVEKFTPRQSSDFPGIHVYQRLAGAVGGGGWWILAGEATGCRGPGRAGG